MAAADSVPYLGLQLQPDGEFELRHKHRVRLAAVHHWCSNTFAPFKVIQDMVTAIHRDPPPPHTPNTHTR